MDFSEEISQLQKALDAIAVKKVKLWWERYLRGTIAFRGVGIPAIRDVVATWRTQTGIASLPDAQQLQVVSALFESPIAEDKLAGILFIQLHLRDRLPWRMLFEFCESLYERRFIFDWNTNDWLCVRVLSPLLSRTGKPCASRLRDWSRAGYLWLARSGAIPFTAVAGDDGYLPDIQDVSETLIRRKERFAKTAVGWLLREVSRHNVPFVETFIGRNATYFSQESLRNATKYFPKSMGTHLVDIAT